MGKGLISLFPTTSPFPSCRETRGLIFLGWCSGSGSVGGHVSSLGNYLPYYHASFRLLYYTYVKSKIENQNVSITSSGPMSRYPSESTNVLPHHIQPSYTYFPPIRSKNSQCPFFFNSQFWSYRMLNHRRRQQSRKT